MITFQQFTSKIWQKREKPVQGNVYHTRLVVRIEGKDYDIQDVTLNNDGVLGEYFVLHTTPLEI